MAITIQWVHCHFFKQLRLGMGVNLENEVRLVVHGVPGLQTMNLCKLFAAKQTGEVRGMVECPPGVLETPISQEISA